MKALILVLMMVGAAMSYTIGSYKVLDVKIDSVVKINHPHDAKSFHVYATKRHTFIYFKENAKDTLWKIPASAGRYWKGSSAYTYQKGYIWKTVDSIYTNPTPARTYVNKLEAKCTVSVSYRFHLYGYAISDMMFQIYVDIDSIGAVGTVGFVRANYENRTDSFTIQWDTLTMKTYTAWDASVETPKPLTISTGKPIRIYDAMGRPVKGEIGRLPQGVYFVWDGKSVRKQLSLR